MPDQLNSPPSPSKPPSPPSVPSFPKPADPHGTTTGLAWPTSLTTTVDDVALVFEGGGMRGAYTAAVLTALLAEGIHFPHVSGISAGSSHTMNYVSRDPWRAHASFVDVAGDERCGGPGYWLRGQGLFNVDFLYDEVVRPGGPLPFDHATFHANPAQVQVGTFNASRGEEVWFGKEDMSGVFDMARCVRASSTLPFLMPPLVIDGETYYDGALGPNGGIALDAPMRAGYRKFVLVLTRPRGYVKGPVRPALDAALAARFRHLPAVREGVVRRPSRYNAALRTIERLEEQGRAWVFRPDSPNVRSTEMDVDKLEAAYRAGSAQIQREMPCLKAFLGM
ncbi:patatin family protein [Schaalia sp. 19OD2882]|uniref:patatin-like phospholipase family protein n=1 Tax=Schaalia sp. 19OD2882 TaxID=2794089 RepID=UPI0020A70028|nr:patatin family protein [Schaalia sp. 19OD2882]